MWFCSSGFGPGPERDTGGAGGERVRRSEGQRREERRHDEHHDQRPADEHVVAALAEPPRDGGGERREGQRPQQDRTLERRPHRCDVVQRRRVGRADLLDVGEREVAGDQGTLHHHHGEHAADERQEGIRRSLAAQPRVAAADADDGHDDAEHTRGQHQQHAGLADRRVGAGREHRHGPSSGNGVGHRRIGLDDPAVGATAGFAAEIRGVLHPLVVDRHVLVGVAHLDAIALQLAVLDRAVHDDGQALAEDAAGLPVVPHRHRRTVERDREHGGAGSGADRPLVDRALETDATCVVASVAHADLVDVAVVVDRRAQELRDDHAAGDEHHRQHDDRHPVPLWSVAGLGGVGCGCTRGEVEIVGHDTVPFRERWITSSTCPRRGRHG